MVFCKAKFAFPGRIAAKTLSTFTLLKLSRKRQSNAGNCRIQMRQIAPCNVNVAADHVSFRGDSVHMLRKAIANSGRIRLRSPHTMPLKPHCRTRRAAVATTVSRRTSKLRLLHIRQSRRPEQIFQSRKQQSLGRLTLRVLPWRYQDRESILRSKQFMRAQF